MLHITSCEWVGGYKLSLSFDNGSQGVADLQDLAQAGSIFEPLQNPEVFKDIQLQHGGVTTWLNGTLDIAPEYLFFLANKDNSELHQQFQKWGYI